MTEWIAATAALLAAIFAGASWLAAKRSAHASDRSADAAESAAEEAKKAVEIETDRRHGEMMPHFELSGREVHDGRVEFTFRHMGPLDSYQEVRFALARQEKMALAGVNLAADANQWHPILTLQNVGRGDGHQFFGLGERRPSTQQFNVTFTGLGAKEWTVSRAVPIQWIPRIW